MKGANGAEGLGVDGLESGWRCGRVSESCWFVFVANEIREFKVRRFLAGGIKETSSDVLLVADGLV